MKKAIIALLSVASMSCSDFLDLKDNNTLNQDSFWKTEEHLDLAVTAAYESLTPEELYGRGIRDLDCISDNGYNEWTWMKYWDISVGQHNPATDRIQWVFNDNYKGIRRANEILDNAPGMGIDQKAKNTAIGEALFLRGLFYNNLSMLFNNVPLILKVVSPAEARIEKASKEEVVDQIIQDLTEAIELLPDKGETVGRINKYAALALRARVYLYNQQYENAIKDCEEVINSGKYSLLDDYQLLFSADGQNSAESIFSVQFVSNLKSGEKFSGTYKKQPQSHFGVLPNLVHDFYTKNGLRAEDDPDATPFTHWTDEKGVPKSAAELEAEGKSIFDYWAEFANRDPRLDHSILRGGEPWVDQDKWDNSVKATRYGIQKYIRTEVGQYEDGDRNFMILRYADVLLMYAEAKNELSGPSGDIYTALNQVRRRVGMPDFDTNLDQDALRQEIRHERRVELAFEGLRYFDELRWRTAKDDFENKVIFHERTFNESKHYWWPLPQTEIDRNPNLTQNPGW
ncbi:RagB/SusD family nutrient uptake outer membrane protein [Flammeovirga yaeyamensis]|uniref:RagB/SusD family nutrient uptake outer membrane protein n=1 Tax=Flammeovirga yaeyamensis TaxID=367791 RepID=A0AAX1NEG6_9BACT|nr:RagB/SusD family nutrient uptake outer membrane protein [Flammeovirga yaeyamensis]MBB3699852.1 tetratricopeptide (TPR) repeat protein [Flammeovirga yaeyamensis]NMF38351.1 RagB/SusD family nutrient uptake outer membrane protein [Flammeovirga yaeyamensis]QWG04762.1 RagB/SusD family nutrient uptake outer membrane protein [Flammeovirga yaeyamensis]